MAFSLSLDKTGKCHAERSEASLTRHTRPFSRVGALLHGDMKLDNEKAMGRVPTFVDCEFEVWHNPKPNGRDGNE